jgi:DNA-binding response OmpR family regulator
MAVRPKAAETGERMRLLARRWHDEPPLRSGKLTLDPGRFQAYLGEVDCRLTPSEFALAFYLLRSGRTVTRSELGAVLWAGLPEPSSRSVAQKMIHIRRKLAAIDPATTYIRGRWKQGYSLAAGDAGLARAESEPLTPSAPNGGRR